MTAFADLHRPGDPLLLPNAWDVGSALLLADAGFAAIGTTSLGVAAAAGLPDGRVATRGATVELTARLARLPALLTVDIEDGYHTEPAAVAGFVAELAALGAVGVNLEDGRTDGSLAPPEAQCATIAAIKALCPTVFVNARADTHWLRPATPAALAEALRRCAAYRAAGADGVFVPGLTDPAGIAALTSGVDAPVNLLYQPGGPTLRQLADLGAARVSLGSLLYRAALGAALAAARAVTSGVLPATGAPSYADVTRLLERDAPISR